MATAAVTLTTSQKDLAHTMTEQARSIVDKALKCCTNAYIALEEARCAWATMIDPIEIAKADKMIKVGEVTVSKLEHTATPKRNIAYGANAFAERACNKYHVAVNVLKNLHDQAAEGTLGTVGNSGGSVSSQGTMTIP